MGFSGSGGGGGGGGGGLTEVATGVYQLAGTDATYYDHPGLTNPDAKYIPVLRWNEGENRLPTNYALTALGGDAGANIQIAIQWNTAQNYWRVYVRNHTSDGQEGEYSLFEP